MSDTQFGCQSDGGNVEPQKTGPGDPLPVSALRHLAMEARTWPECCHLLIACARDTIRSLEQFAAVIGVCGKTVRARLKALKQIGILVAPNRNGHYGVRAWNPDALRRKSRNGQQTKPKTPVPAASASARHPAAVPARPVLSTLRTGAPTIRLDGGPTA